MLIGKTVLDTRVKNYVSDKNTRKTFFTTDMVVALQTGTVVSIDDCKSHRLALGTTINDALLDYVRR